MAREALHAQNIAVRGGHSVLFQGVPSSLDHLSSCPHVVQRLPVTETVGAPQARASMWPLWAVITLHTMQHMEVLTQTASSYRAEMPCCDVGPIVHVTCAAVFLQ